MFPRRAGVCRNPHRPTDSSSSTAASHQLYVKETAPGLCSCLFGRMGRSNRKLESKTKPSKLKPLFEFGSSSTTSPSKKSTIYVQVIVERSVKKEKEPQRQCAGRHGAGSPGSQRSEPRMSCAHLQQQKVLIVWKWLRGGKNEQLCRI